MIHFSPTIIGPLFFLSELCLGRLKKSHSNAKSADAGSFKIIWLAVLSGMALAVVASLTVPGARSATLVELNLVGFMVFVGGVLLRWYSIFYLGRFFTVDVAIAADHQVIDSGPYRYVRHPSYAGALLAFLGLGICFGNVLSLLVIMIATTGAFIYRIKIEEAALIGALGERYVRYAARTKRLIPFVY
jgi:protein-S-isoprenylcysteine O-methyltransferase